MFIVRRKRERKTQKFKHSDTYTSIKQCMCQNDNPDSNCMTKFFVLKFEILKT